MTTVATAILESKLGACWKCMALSSSLLALSLGGLLVAVELLPDPAVLVASAATGFFIAFTAAHVTMFIIRRVIGPREELSGRRLTKGCCG